jgi:hypothetical protein
LSYFGIPTIFSAPASYLCLPIERELGILKSKFHDIDRHSRKITYVLPEARRGVTVTQKFIFLVVKELRGLERGMIKGLFKTQFSKLKVFAEPREV